MNAVEPPDVNPAPSGTWQKPLGLHIFITIVPVTVAALLHLAIAYHNLTNGLYKKVPAVSAVAGTGLTGWLSAYRLLFFKPEITVTTARIYAFWILVILFLAIYLALRSGQRLPSGVGTFVAYLLSALIMVSIATPAIWYVTGSWGPALVELVPPVLMTTVALMMLKSY